MALTKEDIAAFNEISKAQIQAAKDGGQAPTPSSQQTNATGEATPEEPGYWEVIKANAEHGLRQGWAGTKDAFHALQQPGQSFATAAIRRFLPNSVVNRYLDPMRFFVPLDVLDAQFSDKNRQEAEAIAPKVTNTGNSVKDFFGDVASAAGDSALMPSATSANIGKSLIEAGIRNSFLGGKEAAKYLATTGAKQVAGAAGRDLSVTSGAVGLGHLGAKGGEGVAGYFTDDEATKKMVGAGFALPMGLIGGMAGAMRPGAISETAKVAGRGAAAIGERVGRGVKAAGKTLAAVGNPEETDTLKRIFAREFEALLKPEQKQVEGAMKDFLADVATRDPAIAREINKNIKILEGQGVKTDDILELLSPAVLSGNKALVVAEQAGVKQAVTTKQVPAVLAKEAERQKFLAEAADRATAQAMAANKGMQAAYTRATNNPADLKEAIHSVRAFRNLSETVINGAKARAKETLDAMPRLNSTETHDLGEVVRQAQRALRGQAKDAPDLPPGMAMFKDKLYDDAKAIGRQETANTELLAQIVDADKKNIGPKTTASRTPLQTRELLERGAEEGVEIQYDKDGIPVFVKEMVDRPVTLESVLGARQKANQEIARLRTVPGADQDVQYLSRYRDTLNEILNNGSQGFKEALGKADKFYSERYAPLFKEGLLGKMRKPSTLLAPGETRLTSSNAMSSFTKDEESMAEFVRLADGKLSGQPRPEMYDALSRYLEGDIAGKIRDGSIKPENLARWAEANQHALNVVPGTAEKISNDVTRMIAENARAARHEARAKDVLGGPVSSSLGVAQAKSVWADGLANGNKMEFIIAAAKNAAGKEGKTDVVARLVKEAMAMGNPYTDGVFDPHKFGVFLENSNQGLRVLFKHALGSDKAAAAHLDNLRGIARMQQELGSISIKHAPVDFGKYEDPAQAAIGTSIPGITSLGRAVATGKADAGAYAVPYMLFRLYAAKHKAAAHKSWENQIMNPGAANRELLMLSKVRDGKMPSASEVDSTFGDGADAAITDFARSMTGSARNILVPEEIRLHLLRGMLIGGQESYKDE